MNFSKKKSFHLSLILIILSIGLAFYVHLDKLELLTSPRYYYRLMSSGCQDYICLHEKKIHCLDGFISPDSLIGYLDDTNSERDFFLTQYTLAPIFIERVIAEKEYNYIIQYGDTSSSSIKFFDNYSLVKNCQNGLKLYTR